MGKCIAEKTLKKLRKRLGVNSITNPLTEDSLTPSRASTGLGETVINGPVNRYMFREGYAHAAGIVQTFGEHNHDELIARLTAIAINHPCSYAAGVKKVIEFVRRDLDASGSS